MFFPSKHWFLSQCIAAVSCSSVPNRLGGVKIGLGLTGKLGRAWVGAWVVVYGCMGGCMVVLILVGGVLNVVLYHLDVGGGGEEEDW